MGQPETMRLSRIAPILFACLVMFSIPMPTGLADEAEYEGGGITIPPGESMIIDYNLMNGTFWTELVCVDSCQDASMELIQGSTSTLVESGMSNLILETGTTSGAATLEISNNGASLMSAQLQVIAPANGWVEEDGLDSVPASGEDDSAHPLIEVEGGHNATATWLNGSIGVEDDSDIIHINSSAGDVIELWLIHSSGPLDITAWARSNTSVRDLGLGLETSSNTSAGALPSMNYIGLDDGESLWLEVSSPAVKSHWSLRVARHSPSVESVEGEFLARIEGPPTFDFDSEHSFAASGWLDGYDEEDCIGLRMPDSELQNHHIVSVSTNYTSEIQIDIHVYGIQTWYPITTQNLSTGSSLTEAIAPSGTVWTRVCILADEAMMWSADVVINAILDTPGLIPVDATDAQSNWNGINFDTHISSDLQLSVYDAQDTYWFNLNGWPESEYLVRFTCENEGPGRVHFNIIEMNWTDRSIVETSNITLNASQSADITLKVGPGIHLFSVTSTEVEENGGNWTWGDLAIEPEQYAFTASYVQTEEGEEPWFPADPIVGEVSRILIIVLGLGLAIPFTMLLIRERTRRGAARELLGKESRLSVLRRLLERGSITEAREDLSENLKIVSTLTWEQGIGVWGKPDIHHRTEEVDIAAWALDRRLAVEKGIPILIGIHVIKGIWEIAAIRCEAPEGTAWEITQTQPRLLHREDEVFLDQIHEGSRTFVELELAGEGSGVDLLLTGIVKGEPRAAKALRTLPISAWEEE